MGMHTHYEPVDYCDPLALLLVAEGDEDEAEALASQYEAGSHRTSTVEVEKTAGDWLGASPFEVENQYH